MPLLKLNIEVGLIEPDEVESYLNLFVEHKRSDQLLLSSRLYNLSSIFHLLDLNNIDELKCVANTMKLYLEEGRTAYYEKKLDLKIMALLKNNIHTFVTLRILFLATIHTDARIKEYGLELVMILHKILDGNETAEIEEALKVLYNIFNFYTLVDSKESSTNILIDSKYPINDLYVRVRSLVFTPQLTSNALNCLLQFKDFIANKVKKHTKLVDPVELSNGILVERLDKKLVDFLIDYLDTQFTYDNEETGTVFGIIAYLFSWMCYLEFPTNDGGKIKPWLLYIKQKLLPEDVDRKNVFGADPSLAHRVISAFAASATLGIDKSEVDLIPEGDVKPPPMSTFTSERLQELVFHLFNENRTLLLI